MYIMKELICIFLVVISHVLAFTRHTVIRRSSRLQVCGEDLPLSNIHSDLCSKWTMTLANGLDADTLDALGNVGDSDVDIQSIVDGASTNPATSILLKLSGTPLVVVLPIGAGILVALALAFGISSYSNGRVD